MDESNWQDVVVLNPIEKPPKAPRRGKMAKTLAHEASLMQLLSAPPSDYDGTNAKLATYLGVSERTVIRLLNNLKASGQIRVKIQRMNANSGFYTTRVIQIKKVQ